jgi:dihydrofolate reductase
MSVTVSMIAAISRGRVIGKGNDIPWHISEDLKYFKKMTVGKPVIMGRKTYESLGQPLPDRANLIISQTMDEEADERIEVVPNLDLALRAARTVATITGTQEVMIIGGGQIYQAALPEADRIYLTEVDIDIEGDVCFPELLSGWKEVERSDVQTDAKSGLTFTWVTLERE